MSRLTTTLVLPIALWVGIAVPAVAGDGTPADPWEPLRCFVGSWQGEESGAFGEGRGQRTYRFVV